MRAGGAASHSHQQRLWANDEGGAEGEEAATVPSTLCKRENKGALLGGIIRLSGWVQDKLSKPLGT